PIRFVQRITSGRDTVGTGVLVQTMGALVQDSCVLVPPYVRAKGRVVVSKGGGRFGRHGRLGLRFDSLEVRSGHWVPIAGVLDTLEYAKPGAVTDSGLVSSGRTSVGGLGKKLVPAGVVAAVDFDVIPVTLLGGFSLLRRGPPVRIQAGETGGIRLTEPLVLPGRERCDLVATHRELTEMPALPTFVPRSENRSGTVLGDPFNVLLLGTSAEIDSAFRAAGWLPAQKRSVLAVTREVTAAIASRPAITAPVSTQYFEGRPQDLAYELAGPNVRIRHHIRIWLLDSLSLVWVGAANHSSSDRALQDDVIRALADAPYRASPRWRRRNLADPDRVERYARFLARHFYYERIVQFFKYSRALARITGRAPEAVCKGDAF